MPHLGSFPLLYSVLCCCWWDCTTLANVAGREVKKKHQLLLPKCFYMDYIYCVVKFSWCIMFEKMFISFSLAMLIQFILLFFFSLQQISSVHQQQSMVQAQPTIKQVRTQTLWQCCFYTIKLKETGRYIIWNRNALIDYLDIVLKLYWVYFLIYLFIDRLRL